MLPIALGIHVLLQFLSVWAPGIAALKDSLHCFQISRWMVLPLRSFTQHRGRC